MCRLPDFRLQVSLLKIVVISSGLHPMCAHIYLIMSFHLSAGMGRPAKSNATSNFSGMVGIRYFRISWDDWTPPLYFQLVITGVRNGPSTAHVLLFKLPFWVTLADTNRGDAWRGFMMNPNWKVFNLLVVTSPTFPYMSRLILCKKWLLVISGNIW